MSTQSEFTSYLKELDKEVEQFLQSILIAKNSDTTLKIQRSTIKNICDRYEENMSNINRKYHQAEELHVNIPRENQKSWQ